MEKDIYLVLRDAKKRRGIILYTGAYLFDRVNYTVFVYDDKVIIRRTVKTKDYSVKSKSASDAICKAYVLFALSNGRGLDIKEFYLGDKEYKDLIDADYAEYREGCGLPFVVSMLKDSYLAYDTYKDNDGYIFHNKRIMDAFAVSKRSEYQTDKRFIALFAYLVSRSREYEMDRFLNQWTAINAIYDMLIGKYDEMLTNAVKSVIAGRPEASGISDDTLAKMKNLPDSDNQKVWFIIEYMDKRHRLTVTKDQNSDKNVELLKIDTTFKDDFKYFIEKKKSMNKIWYDCSQLEYACLSSDWESYFWENTGRQAVYDGLKDMSQRAGCTLNTFFTFVLPYHIRNDYIHGSMAALIFSDRYNVNKLAIANYFMDSFIREMLLVLFDEEALKRELLAIHIYKNDKNKRWLAHNRSKGTRQSVVQHVQAARNIIKRLINPNDNDLAWLKKSL